MTQAVLAPRASLENRGLQAHIKGLGGLGNETYVDARSEQVPVSRIARFAERLGYWQERYPLVACTPEDPKTRPFDLTSPQDLTTLLMSKAMRFLPNKPALENITANRYCSGASVDDVISEMKGLEIGNPLASAIANYSGEHTETLTGVRVNMQTYIELINRVSTNFPNSGLRFSTSTISLKPSQFGTYVGEAELRELFPEIFSREPGDEALWTARFLFALNNITYLANYAKGKVDIWVDMEDHRLTTFTAHILYPSLLGNSDNVGVIFQGNLVRTGRDVNVLLRAMPESEHHFRTCKGVYYDGSVKVYVPMDERTRSFVELNRFMVGAPERYGVSLVLASASMDLECQREVLKAFREKDNEKLMLRMQVLKGCCGNELMEFVRKEGVPLDTYLIFGDMIFPYTFRRLRKNPIVEAMMEGRGNWLVRTMLKPPSWLYGMFYEGNKNNEPLPELL